jgi:hypothetical protein
MEASDLNIVNPHYLQNVMDLAKNHEVIASEDIYDAKGVKLVAKGTRVSDSLQERLVRFKLRKPLESSLSVEGGVGADALLAEAQIVLDEVAPLSALMQAGASSKAVLQVLKEVRFDKVSTLVLSMEQSGQGGTFRHAVLAAVTSVALGIRMHLDSGTLLNLALAGLLHDTGELYINPEFRHPTRPLTPEEWKHIAAHPRIGQLVLEEMTGIPRSVSTAIAEHHERPNGFGYPRQLTSERISQLGNVLLMTEVLCGIFVKPDRPLERACLALKVIPGEYPVETVSIIASARRGHLAAEQPPMEASKYEELMARAKRIEPMMNTALEQVANPLPGGKSTPAASVLLAQVRERLLMLRRSMYSTGLAGCADMEITDASDQSDIVLELDSVSSEIAWRLRELSRQITLNLSSLDDGQREYFEKLVACLV